MHLRVRLQPPHGEPTTLDAREGVWVEPGSDPEVTLGDGLWALPGLVDAHAHLAKETMDFLPGDYEGAVARVGSALTSGVMLALDKGWRDLTVVDVIDRVPPEERPDIETAGVMHAVAGGYYDGFARNIDPGSMAGFVTRAAAESRGWVKLVGDWPRKGVGPVANFSEAELATAVEAAAEQGARVAVHTMAREVPAMAVRAGVQSIEHGLFLSADDIHALGSRRGIWVPTLLQVEALIGRLGPTSSGGRLLAEGLENVLRLVPEAAEAGVHVLAGTDLAVSSDRVGLEAVRMWEMGVAAEIAVAAVSGAGLEAAGRSPTFEVGSPANAVLFAENPVVNPRVLSHPEAVVRLGVPLG